MNVEKFVYLNGRNWHWFVISDCNNHVLAEGTAKFQKVAQRQVNQAANIILHNMAGAE